MIYLDINVLFQKWWPHILLLKTLVIRDIKGQYRRSLIGPGWAILQPLGYMLTFVFLGKVANIQFEGVPYAIFILSGLIPWLFFSNAINRCATSIFLNADIIKKMPICREIFPVSTILVSFMDFIISSLLIIIFMFYYQIPLTLSLLWLPVLIFIVIFFSISLGLGVAIFGTFKSDVTFALPFLLQLWMFSSPIFYPISTIPEEYRFWYSLNPITGITEGFRSVIVMGTSPDLHLLGISFSIALLIMLLTLPVFRYYSQYVADVV